ncbi:MAG: hypothetical protein KIT45_05640 [Fimbriimonadia bacterium]|nr:hypothetical protein [Fimbriimonadia bacterium]
MTTLDKRDQYLTDVLIAFKEGDLDMSDTIKAIRKRKPNQAKVDGAKEFAQLITTGRIEEAFGKYRFGLKNVRARRARKNGRAKAS